MNPIFRQRSTGSTQNIVNKKERYSREQALLNTALGCFNNDQWENVSVSEIADKAGVAKGTVYLHFASKHEIYARLALQFYNTLLTDCRNLSSTDSRTRLKQFIHTVFRHHQSRPEYRRVTQYCQREDFIKNLNPELAQSLTNIEHQFRSVIKEILTNGIQDGSWSTDAANNMPGIFYTIKGALTQFCRIKNTDQESQLKIISAITNYILSSVGPRTKSQQVTDTLSFTLDQVLET